MTYCLAINTNEGLVLCSDSRTNAGFDNVSTYNKMHTFSWLNNRFITILSSGNLATTQQVLKKIQTDIDKGFLPNLLSVNSMHEAIDYIASVSTTIQNVHVVRDASNTSFQATFIVAGQIGSDKPETCLIYPQGNYIHESDEHPYIQIGETKYGKPILDRIISRETSLNRAARCALVSMNSTIRSNLTVGPPIDLMLYEKDSLSEGRKLHLTEDDTFAKELAEKWNNGLINALMSLPKFEWEQQDQLNSQNIQQNVN
ncbi:MAG: peptidase [Methylotenera sp.]|jgi:putative proteasome-type protease